MIKNLELFVEKMLKSGVGEELDSTIFKNDMNEALGRLADISDTLEKTLTKEQLKLYQALDNCLIDYESIIEKAYFYRGYRLAISFAQHK